MSSRRSFVIIVTGIKLSELHEELANTSREKDKSAQITNDGSVRSIIEYAKFARIPTTFIRMDDMPRRTNLLCWHCALPFNSIPRFIALEYKRVLGNDGNEAREWTIEGNFCSWSCAAAYIETYQDTKKWNLQQNLTILRAQIDGIHVLPVKPAPPRTIMRAYCGANGMAQQEFERTVAEFSLAVPDQKTTKVEQV